MVVTPLRRKAWAEALVALVLALTLFCLAYLAPISLTGSDPRYSLLVSQAILENQTVRLDAYMEGLTAEGHNPHSDARIFQHNGHYYDYFPLGPALFAAPGVWLARLAGLDMVRDADDTQLQRLFAALSCMVALVLVFLICRSVLTLPGTLLITCVTVFGSTLTSTMATALWNLNFAVIFLLACVWLLVRLERAQAGKLDPYLLGVLLWAAFISRPTTALFSLLVFAYLFACHRRRLAATGVTFALPLLCFMIFTRWEYGAWLPPYYLPSRLGSGEIAPAFVVLAGLLFSPGRGLFVFTPVCLLVILVALWRAMTAWRTQSLLSWLALAWFGLHTVALLRFWHWWGGHSFGPRILTDIMPAFLLLTVLWWRDLTHRPGTRTIMFGASLYAILGGIGVLTHSYLGLYHLQTFYWNGAWLAPNIDLAPDYLFAWRYPQIWTDGEAQCARNLDYQRRLLDEGWVSLTPITPGLAIQADAFEHLRTLRITPRWWSPGEMIAKWSGAPLDGSANLPARSPVASHHLYLPMVGGRTDEHGQTALLAGWSTPDETGIWMLCTPASIVVGRAQGFDQGPRTTFLDLTLTASQPYVVDVHLNDELVGVLTLNGGPQTHQFAVAGELLSGAIDNRIQLTAHGGFPRNEVAQRQDGIRLGPLRFHQAEQ